MFHLFQKRPPLSTFARVDIELLLRRNVEVCGRDDVLKMEYLTDAKSLDFGDGAAEQWIQSAASSVAGQMQMNIDDVQVIQSDDPEFAYTSLYDDGRIFLHPDVVGDELRTVTELANQFAHHFWLRQPSPRPLDHHPRTTTLLPIVQGFGVLAAKASLQESHWTAAGYSGWSMSRSGYYSAIEIGYALALLARLRGEARPKWYDSLRLDAKKTFDSAARYFDRQQSLGRPLLFDSQRIPSSHCDSAELSKWLSGPDPAFAMASAYALAKSTSLPSVATDAAMELTESKDLELVVLATRLLAIASSDHPDVDGKINRLARHRSGAVALAAMHAASTRGLPVSPYQKRIEKLLMDPHMEWGPVLDLVNQHPQSFASLSPAICRQAELAVRFGDSEAIDALSGCLVKIAQDPVAEIESRIRSRDTRDKILATVTGRNPNGELESIDPTEP
ncbi:hypothetical protein K227x_36500 [Rubripirellula lacrimiformis]|uniref:Uncharacterized protein n=1 Tax=Rubripirellula lacrimiformis TaxID=1930273 RepID=A0A517NDP0_9BACT|nr:hypothetical protein [Rubripirellula lacrimiformis]QDT05250.1 hypothetical protein K227x_36500 [Rubripirellula lacrimiformis]